MEQKMSNEYVIPLEIPADRIAAPEYKKFKIDWFKMGNRMVKAVLIPTTKELYSEYMRPIWREDKYQQRRKNKESSINEAYDKYELELQADFNLEDAVIEKDLCSTLHDELNKLSETDRTILLMYADGFSESAIGKRIGLSQKSINKRKHRLFSVLKNKLTNNLNTNS